jgi:DNA-binding response OmpR family regulator
VTLRKAEGLEQKAKIAEPEVESSPLPALNPQHLEIVVRDTGVGIPAKALPHIFDYFYRYQDKNARRESGTGIGLALTKELVELHHGKIAVTSAEGAGSEFVIHLPLGKTHLKPEEIAGNDLEEIKEFSLAPAEIEAVVEDDHGVAATRESFAAEKQSARATILLVEDNSDMRRYLREHLNHQHRLFEASNGEDGVRQALQEIPDLVISDVMMPKMDGLELCRKLKANELTSHIPIILLTARGSGESKLKGLELGADEYLTKPLNARELQLRIKNLMAQQQKLRRRYREEITALDANLAGLPAASSDEKFLKRAAEVLEKHLANPGFSPEMFADAMMMSRPHLNRKLRGLLGQRTGEFIRTMRLKRAAELLRQKSGTVSEIAFQVGFNHLSYFARSFRAQYGQSPHEYGH